MIDALSAVPVVQLEEHNEALIAIAWAIEQGHLPKEPAALLHVDQHADLDVPHVRHSLAAMRRSISAMKEIVANEISISTFIWAGVYLGLIDDVSWLPPPSPFPGAKPRSAAAPRKLVIATTDPAHLEFTTAILRPETANLGNNDRRTLTLRFGDPAQDPGYLRKSGDCGWILSIDLDYFSCNSTPDNGFRIEVAKSSYDDFCGNPHHPLRLSVYHRVDAVQSAGRYYFEFDMFEPRVADPLVRSEAEIDARIAELRDVLVNQACHPKLVVVARSCRSGFTPTNQCALIESKVLAMLAGIYDCQVMEGNTLW